MMQLLSPNMVSKAPKWDHPFRCSATSNSIMLDAMHKLANLRLQKQHSFGHNLPWSSHPNAYNTFT